MADTWPGAAYQDEPDGWCIVLFWSVEGKKVYMYVCMRQIMCISFKPALNNSLCDIAQ